MNNRDLVLQKNAKNTMEETCDKREGFGKLKQKKDITCALNQQETVYISGIHNEKKRARKS